MEGDAAADGAVIEVAAGTYGENASLDTLGKSVTIRGEVDAEGVPLTVLDGQNSHRLFQCVNGEGPDTVFENLVFSNGYVSYGSGGGGAVRILNSSPIFRNCRFESNEAYQANGGAVYQSEGSAQFLDCVFIDNQTLYRDGGGAIYSRSGSISLSGCVFSSNESIGDEPGGALWSFNDRVTISSCMFSSNTSSLGGALYLNSANAGSEISSCVISSNVASQAGGIYFTQSSGTVMTDTVLCGNDPESVQGAYTDGGGNCIRNACVDSDEDGVPDCNGDPDLELQVPSEYATIGSALDAAADPADLALAQHP